MFPCWNRAALWKGTKAVKPFIQRAPGDQHFQYCRANCRGSPTCPPMHSPMGRPSLAFGPQPVLSSSKSDIDHDHITVTVHMVHALAARGTSGHISCCNWLLPQACRWGRCPPTLPISLVVSHKGYGCPHTAAYWPLITCCLLAGILCFWQSGNAHAKQHVSVLVGTSGDSSLDINNRTSCC